MAMASRLYGRTNNLKQTSGVHGRLGQRQQDGTGPSRLFAAAIPQPEKPSLSKFDARQKLSGQNSGTIQDARQKLLQKTKFADARERIDKKKVQMHSEAVSDMRMKLLEKRRLGVSTGPTTATDGKQSAAGQQLAKATPMIVTVSNRGRMTSASTGDNLSAAGKRMVATYLAAGKKMVPTNSLSRLKPPPTMAGTFRSDQLTVTARSNQGLNAKTATPFSAGSKVHSGAGDRVDPYVVHITNDLYQLPQPAETVVTNRTMQRTAGAAEAAAAKALASATGGAAAVGPSTRAGVLNRANAHSTAGLVGLHQKTQMAASSLTFTATAASPLQGFQTLVSNLHPDVTLDDVMELFGDIGPLKNARLVKPGVADVIFVNVEDALTAVKTYHMRLLDGQPMSVELKFEPTADQSAVIRSKPVLDLDTGVVKRALFKTMTDVGRRTPVSFTVQV